MDPELIRLAQQVWDEYRSENGAARALQDLGPRPELPDDSPTFKETAQDVATQFFRGPAVAVTQFGKGLADLLGMEQTAANLRARRAAIEEITGPPETLAGKATGIGSRIAGEAGLFTLPAGALRAAGQGARMVGAATRSRRLLSGGRRVARGGLLQDIVAGSTVDAPIEAGAAPEESLASFLGFQDAAQTPAGRALVGVPVGAGFSFGLGSLIGLERGARGRAREAARQAAEAIEPTTEAVRGGTRGAVRVSDIEPELPREHEFDVQVQDIAPDELAQGRISQMKEAGLTTPEQRAQVEIDRLVESARDAGVPLNADDIAQRFGELVKIESRYLEGKTVLRGRRRGLAEVEAAAPGAELREAQALSAEQMTRLKREADAARRTATRILDEAEALPPGSPEWRAAQDQADQILSVFDEAAAGAITGISEAARTLAIHRAQLGIANSALAWIQQGKRALGRELTTGERNMVRRWHAEGNTDDMVRWAWQNREAVTPDDPRFYGQFIKSMYLLPLSVARAVVGNVGRLMVDLPGRPAASVFDRILGIKTGQSGAVATTPAVVRAWGQGITKGLKEIPQVATSGLSPADIQKLDIVRTGKRLESPVRFTYKGKTYDVVNGLAQLPYTMLAMADRPFAGAAYLGTLVEMAEASGDDIARFVSNPPPDAVALATFTADVAAARQETFFGRAAQRFKEGISGPTVTGQHRVPSRVREALSEVMVPFTTAPGAVTQLAVDTNPVTGAALTVRDITRLMRIVGEGAKPSEIRELQRMAAKRFGRWTTGGAIGMAVGMRMGMDDRYSGPVPLRSQTERQQFFREGKKAFSFLIGDQWVPATQAYPFSTAMVFGAEIGRAIKNGENPLSGVGQGTLSIIPMVGESPFVQGPARIAEAIQDPGGMEELVSRTAGSVVPGVVAAAARAEDPTLRIPEPPVAGEVLRRIPGLSEELPARLDPFTGEPIRRTREGEEIQGAFGLPAVFGAGPDLREDDPMLQEFSRLNFVPQAIAKRRGESDEDYRTRLQSEGPILADAMRRVVQDEGERVVAELGSQGSLTTPQGVNLLRQIRDYEALKAMEEQTPAIMEYQRDALGNIVEQLKRSIARVRNLQEMVDRIRALRESR